MPTTPRINLAGYHHIINKGVNLCEIFSHNDDKKKFLEIINKTAIINKVILHNYVLMDDHYHLLIETKTENLSTFMRIVNANYAQYYNRKYNRSGHLWQGRYKSKFIINEVYFYILIRYIENIPIKAGITKSVGKYPYTLSFNIFNRKNYHPCFYESLLIKEFNIHTLRDFLNRPITNDEEKYLQKKQKQKIKKINNEIVLSCSLQFKEHFSNIETKKDRNIAIINAYLDGYAQVDIANYLQVSKSLISKVIKNVDPTPKDVSRVDSFFGEIKSFYNKLIKNHNIT